MNNTKVLIIKVLFLIPFFSLAQNREFAPIGAQWQYGFATFGVQGTQVIKVVKDTVLDNEKVKKLEITNYSIEYFNNDNKKDTTNLKAYLKIQNDSIFSFIAYHSSDVVKWKYMYKAHPRLLDSIDWNSSGTNCFKKGKVDSVYQIRIQDSMYQVARYLVKYKIDYGFSGIFEGEYYLNFIEGVGFTKDYFFLMDYCSGLADGFEYYDMCFKNKNLAFSENNNSACSLVASTQDDDLKGINFYPNPVNDVLNIEMSENTEGGKLTMTNVMGQTILSKTIQPFEKFISVETAEIKNGIYIIQLRANGKKATQKLIIQH